MFAKEQTQLGQGAECGTVNELRARYLCVYTEAQYERPNERHRPGSWGVGSHDI